MIGVALPSNKKLKVLVLAEAANPEWTSEPLVGWSHSEALSKICDTHLVTQIRNKDAIERFGWKEGAEFTALNTEVIMRPLHSFVGFLRGSNELNWSLSTAANSLLYPYFEYLVWKKFSAALKNNEYDIVHRITPVSPSAPSLLAKKLKKINIPFVVGPINGGTPWPKEFPELKSEEKEWFTHFRFLYKCMPGYRGLQKHSSCILTGSIFTAYQLPDNSSDKCVYLPENAIDLDRFSVENSGLISAPLRAATVSRLVPLKVIDLAIEAMLPLLRANKMRFDIFGSGPEKEKLSALIEKESLQDSVTLHGFVPHDQLQYELSKSDIFIFPSVREFGGGAVLEAMALGLVPIVCDYAGPAELVSDDCGFKIPIGPRDTYIANIQQCLDDICNSPDILTKKRNASLQRVHDFFTWDRKALQTLQVYRWLLNKDEKPNFETAFLG